MNAPSRPSLSLACRVGLALLVILAALWLWAEWCRFPLSPWNDVRLVPSFMFAAGEPVYSPPHSGVVSTWMYGPVPVWLLLPAVCMPDIASASMTAGGLNIGLQLAAILYACARWPAPGVSASGRVAAACLVIAVWPAAAWRFIQADNYAVTFGLVSSTILLGKSRSPIFTWLAAAAAVAACGCKQTSLGIPLAQVIWFASTRGPKCALEYILRLAACGALLCLMVLATLDIVGVWDTMVRLPGQIPFTDEVGRRLADLAQLLLVHVGVPPVLYWALLRQSDPDTSYRLGHLLWLCSLPFGALSLLKAGGSINSLQGLHLALPSLALALSSRLTPFPRLAWPGALVIGAIFILRFQEFGTPLSPRVDHLREGVALVHANPGQLWLPWNPLVSYYAEGRFHHAEDGFYARLLAGRAIDLDRLVPNLPPRFTAIGELAWMNGWGISKKILNRPYDEHVVGSWRLSIAIPAPEASQAEP